MPRRKSFIEGDIIKVPINDKEHTYGRKLTGFLIALYNCKTDTDINDIDTIIKSQILFIVTAYKSTLKEDILKKVGNIPLTEELKKKPTLFIKDILPKGAVPTYRIIYEDMTERMATLEECKNLEPMAVFNAENITNRLNDVYYGDPDKWLKDYLFYR